MTTNFSKSTRIRDATVKLAILAANLFDMLWPANHQINAELNQGYINLLEAKWLYYTTVPAVLCAYCVIKQKTVWKRDFILQGGLMPVGSVF